MPKYYVQAITEVFFYKWIEAENKEAAEEKGMALKSTSLKLAQKRRKKMFELAPVVDASSPHPCTVLTNTDWRMLKAQRLALSHLLEVRYIHPDDPLHDTLRHLHGIRNFLEALTDAFEDRYGTLKILTAPEEED